VYLEERLGTAPNEVPNVTSVAVFIGLAAKGPVGQAVRIDSWTDFVDKFGAFSGVPYNTVSTSATPIASPPKAYALDTEPTLRVSDDAGSAVFTSEYVGTQVTGDPGIPGGATITAVAVDGSTATLSAAVTDDVGLEATGVALTYTIPAVPAVAGTTLSYLAYAVYSYYQNGGRSAYVVRIAPASSTQQGEAATVEVKGAADALSLGIEADGRGAWGNTLAVRVQQQATLSSGRKVFTLSVLKQASGSTPAETLEVFSNLSMTGNEGTRPATAVLNDPVAGSRYIVVTSFDTATDPSDASTALTGGTDLGLPNAADFSSLIVQDAVKTIENPTMISMVPYMGSDGTVIMPPPQSLGSAFSVRGDAFIVWDSNPLSLVVTDHATDTLNRAAQIGTGDSYSAIYSPWIIVPDPALPGGTVAIPPSGAVLGMMARLEATVGIWKAPAGIQAVLSNAIQTELKYAESDQGRLNYNNVNVIRSTPGSGICVMGARTRKLYGPDRFVSNRRMIIYLKERLRLSTQFAVFENNDQRLWSALRNVAVRVLNPIWDQGGLRGANASEAYYVRCDATINTPTVIQSGEVRMEIGVALQYPAEFVIIRISQFEAGTSSVSEIVS